MAQQIINIGTPNNENGDFVRDAFDKANDNFTELYAHTLSGLSASNEIQLLRNGDVLSTIDLSSLAKEVTIADRSGNLGELVTTPGLPPAGTPEIGSIHIEFYDDVTAYFVATASDWVSPTVVKVDIRKYTYEALDETATGVLDLDAAPQQNRSYTRTHLSPGTFSNLPTEFTGATTIHLRWTNDQKDPSTTDNGMLEAIAQLAGNTSLLATRSRDAGSWGAWKVYGQGGGGSSLEIVDGNDVTLSTAAEKLKISGRTTLRETVPDEFDIRIGYKTIQATDKPSWVQIDNISVIDNGDGTLDIYDNKEGVISSSAFGVKPDLKYIDVTLNGTSTFTTTDLLQEDVGKMICIRKAHKNLADGTNQHARTQRGRIVTVTDTITSVTDGVDGTIAFTPSESASVRAYVATNNFQSLQQAINFCLWQNIGELRIDGAKDSIAVFNPHDKGLFTGDYAQPALYWRSDENKNLKITSVTGTLLKMSAENMQYADIAHGFHANEGNGDVEISVNVLSPDEHYTMYHNNGHMFYTNAGASVRSIKVADQEDRPDLCDNNDANWAAIAFTTNGGIDNVDPDLIEYQKVYFENINCNTRCDGLAVFSNNGATVQMWGKNINIPFRWNYLGENGRSFASGINDQDSRWEFSGFDITISGGGTVATIAEVEDFSWLDYPIGPRYFNLFINGTGGNARLANPGVGDAKVITLTNSTLSDGVYSAGFTLTYNNNLGHPFYGHPNVAFDLDNVKISYDEWRYYSSSGKAGAAKFANIRNCDFSSGFRHERVLPDTDSPTIMIDNSKVNFTNLRASFNAKDSELSGVSTRIFELISRGGNRFTGNYICYNPISELYFFNDTFKQLSTFLNVTNTTSCDITFDNCKFESRSRFPQINNGSVVFKNIKDGSIWLENSNSPGAASDVDIKFIDSMFTVDGNSTALRTTIGNATTIEFIGSSHIPNFSNDTVFRSGNFTTTDPQFGAFRLLESSIVGDIYYENQLNDWGWYWSQNHDLRFGQILGGQKADKFKFTGDNTYNMFYLTTKSAGNQFFGYSGMWDAPYYDGDTLDVHFSGTNKIDPFYKTGAVQMVRPGLTIGNIIQKNIDRVDGEIVTFKVDGKNNRLIEISSTVSKKYSATEPTRTGMDGEIIYDSTDPNEYAYWEYEIDYVDLAGTVLTTSVVTESRYTRDGVPITTPNNMQVMNTSKWLSIGQERTDGTDLVDFQFTLIDNTATEHTFNHVTSVPTGVGFDEFSKHFWAFSDGTDEIYIDNEDGKLIVRFSNPLSFTLQASNNLRIDRGLEITRAEWVRKHNSTNEGTGTTIDLSNQNGMYYNMSTPSTSTTFTVTDERTGGWAKTRFNTPTAPTVTGGTREGGDAFVVSTDMDMLIWHDGTGVKYTYLNVTAP